MVSHASTYASSRIARMARVAAGCTSDGRLDPFRGTSSDRTPRPELPYSAASGSRTAGDSSSSFHAAADATGLDLNGHFNRLLTAVQAVGAVRHDVDFADVKALLAGCLARERDNADPAARDRMIAIVRSGLRPAPAAPREAAGPGARPGPGDAENR